MAQVDAILSQRGRHNEHEAQREIKNEFMALWDGIKAMGSAADDRILVRACRPSLASRACRASHLQHRCDALHVVLLHLGQPHLSRAQL